MKIGFDITPTQTQFKYRGIGTVAYNVIKTWIKTYPQDQIIVFKYDAPSTLDNLLNASNVKAISFGKFHLSTIKNLYTYYVQKLPIVKKYLSKMNAYYVFHLFDGFMIKHNPQDTLIGIMIHDLTVQKLQTYSRSQNPFARFIKKQEYIYYHKRLKNYADFVITNSQTTKNDLISYKYCNASKTFVAHLGPSNVEIINKIQNENTTDLLSKYKLQNKKYILYDGGYQENKNIIMLLEAYLKIARTIPYKLVLLGNHAQKIEEGKTQNTYEQKLYKLIKRLPQNKLVIIPTVDQDIYFTLKKYAAAFIHLSKYEGFGLSVLDALMLNVPVIAYPNSAYVENFKKYLIFAKTAQQVAHAIQQIQNAKRLNYAIELKKIFTWEKHVKKIRDTIETIRVNTQ